MSFLPPRRAGWVSEATLAGHLGFHLSTLNPDRTPIAPAAGML